jgi:hypothetical protein
VKRSEAIVEKIRRQLPQLYLNSARHLGTLSDGSHPGAHETKLTRQDKAALALMAGMMAADRAKQTSEAVRQLGVVVVHARRPDTPQNRLEWEADAAKLQDARAIEAVAVPKEPDAT